MGRHHLRLALAAACLSLGASAWSAEPVDEEFFTENEAVNVIPPPSEEALIFTGEKVTPLTPSPTFSQRMDTVLAEAKTFTSFLSPTIWAILIAGFALVGFVVRKSERVLHFDPDAVSRRKARPEDASAGSAPDASTPPHSGTDPAPSAPRDQAE